MVLAAGRPVGVILATLDNRPKGDQKSYKARKIIKFLER
jgi:hypothetical protein